MEYPPPPRSGYRRRAKTNPNNQTKPNAYSLRTPPMPQMPFTTGLTGGQTPMSARQMLKESAGYESSPKRKKRGGRGGRSKNKKTQEAAYDSDSSSGGGAPLHSSFPEQTDLPKQDATSPADEQALLRASTTFTSLNVRDPFSDAPGIPRSVPPTAFHIPSQAYPYTHPTPTRPGNAIIRPGTSHAANRFRPATSGRNDASNPWYPNMNGGGARLNGPPDFPFDGTETAQTSHLFRLLMTASQYARVSPGMPTSTANELDRVLRDISQGLSSVTVTLRRQRDNAEQAKEQEAEKALDAQKSLAELHGLLQQTRDREALLRTENDELKDDNVDLKNERDNAVAQLKSLEEQTKVFQEHHQTTIKKFQEQDEKHYLAVTALEDELRAAREHRRRSADQISVSQPDSVNNVEERDEISNSPPQKLITTNKGTARKPEQIPSGSGDSQRKDFVPNPSAPSWAPGGGARLRPDPNSESGRESSSSGSGEVILYQGRNHQRQNAQRGNQSMAMTPYQQAQSRSTSQTVRTPFGVIRGGYPTVEQNAHLPGGHPIPRDKEEWAATDVQRAMAHLYALCQGCIVTCHLQGAPQTPYASLATQQSDVWKYMLRMVYKDANHASSHMQYLLSTRAFIPYILQRMCVEYVLKKIMAPQIFIDFSPETDSHLTALQDKLAAMAGTKDRQSRNRQRIIEDHAKLIRAMAAAPGIEVFRQNIADRHAIILGNLLAPMRSEGVEKEILVKSLRLIIAACWDISIKIWSSGQTLHYVFPECASKYTPGTMEAMNGQMIAKTPEELCNSQCRLSLVITPTMTLRDDRDSNNLQCHVTEPQPGLSLTDILMTSLTALSPLPTPPLSLKYLTTAPIQSPPT
ncbi:hypothetical protein F5Y18DRAFT_437553 [Xylariaceae sp. FL1019]|nr:hypothetical protein F5Y18DRAFT_437553 [Xylariaceae sp. FL1019]